MGRESQALLYNRTVQQNEQQNEPVFSDHGPSQSQNLIPRAYRAAKRREGMQLGTGCCNLCSILNSSEQQDWSLKHSEAIWSNSAGPIGLHL